MIIILLATLKFAGALILPWWAVIVIGLTLDALLYASEASVARWHFAKGQTSAQPPDNPPDDGYAEAVATSITPTSTRTLVATPRRTTATSGWCGCHGNALLKPPAATLSQPRRSASEARRIEPRDQRVPLQR